jgi:hypothetical protein
VTPFFNAGVKVIEVGVLDGMTLNQVKDFAPEINMNHLCTRMSNGSEVAVAKEKILSKLEAAIKKIEI